MSKKAKADHMKGQLSFDLDALMAADEDVADAELEDFIEKAENFVFCANLGCDRWDCRRHNRNAPWGEICNFKQFPGTDQCKGYLD